MKIVNDLLLLLDDRKSVFLALLDLSAAFDTVDHDILLRRLDNSFGVRDTALNCFSSYLKERKMQVVINEVMSEIMQLNSSVPQGSIIGPRSCTQSTKSLGLFARL